MKTTQAWGWLAAGVMALGVNGFYHDGGMELAHRAMDRITDRSQAVIALASERADGLLARVEMVSASEQNQCRLATAAERFRSHGDRTQVKIANAQSGFDRFEAMSDREKAQLARLEASRTRIEAQAARFRFAAFNPVTVRIAKLPSICPRVHVVVPQPNINIAIPDIQVRTGTEPI